MVKNVSVSVLNTDTGGSGIHNRYRKYIVNNCLLPSILTRIIALNNWTSKVLLQKQIYTLHT